MLQIHFTHADGSSQSASVNPGQSLMRAASEAGIVDIAAICGGCLTCATCHVIVGDAWLAALPGPSVDEDAMLDMTASPREPGSRLACQIVLGAELDGLSLRLPESQY